MDDRAVPRLSPTVLLVDDETAIRSLLARRLQASGYRVISAASGREALKILTQEVVTIDLLLTDVMMPGLIGPQLAAIVQSRWPSVRRLGMTGGATDTALRLMGESNIQCLRKPFTDAELREALKTALVGPGKTGDAVAGDPYDTGPISGLRTPFPPPPGEAPASA